MAIEINTKVTIASPTGRSKVGNLILEDAKFFGRPNFSGQMDQFKDDSRKFTVLIPIEVAEELKSMGWNIKVTEPNPEFPDQVQLAHMKVKIDFSFDPQAPGDFERERGPKIFVKQGEALEQLHSNTVGILDRSFIETMDMEIRGWEYNPDEAPGMLSARLVGLVATLRQSLLSQKYGVM